MQANRLMRTVAIVGAAALLGGCTSLQPRYVSVEATHVSHLTQHRPFTQTPTQYGYNAAGAALTWGDAPGTSLTIAESVNLNAQHGDAYGSLPGPREVFTITIAHTWRIR